MEMLDRIFRFATASFKATRKVKFKYISTIHAISTSFFSVFIGNEFVEKIAFEMLIFIHFETMHVRVPLQKYS